jgi:hypothetical protein
MSFIVFRLAQKVRNFTGNYLNTNRFMRASQNVSFAIIFGFLIFC